MVSASPDDSGRPRPGRPAPRTLRLLGLLAAAAVVAAVLLAPRLATLRPASATGSPGPTFNLPAALDAQVDQAGSMRSGGIWAVAGPYLLTSTDNGATWRAGDFPSPGGPVPVEPVYVLDQDHAWAIASAGLDPALSAGSGAAGTAAAGVPFLVDRTSDGGRSWQEAPVSGDFGCDTATLSFVDANIGFIMCSVGSRAAPGSGAPAEKGSGTVLRTVDGGATWSVAGGAPGLGSRFTAADATTLWSAPDGESPALAGVALYVSRNSGGTWSAVDLPDLASVPAGAQVGIVAGPAFWDASNGAIAVGVGQSSSGGEPAVWFYRTSDAGSSWTLVKKPTSWPVTNIPTDVLAGREWAVPGDGGLYGLTVSRDFGATWIDVPGFGMPQNGGFQWVDFTDPSHGAAVVSAVPGASFARSLMLSSDGGRTWHATDYGDARANVPASSILDPAAAENLADEFQMMTTKDPQTAWIMLSSYSQRAYGGEAAFESAEAALGKRTGYASRLGQPTQISVALSQTGLSGVVWSDLTTFADTSRAYEIVVTYPGTSEPQRRLIAAPLSVNGDWRVWVVTP